MLRQIYLKNFKAFREQRLDLAPITVLVGPNNSGKSSLFAPLRILNQTLTSFDYRVPLLLNGPLGDFGSYRDLVFGNHPRRPLTIGLTASSRSRPQTGPSAPRAISLELEYKYRPQRRELLLREVDLGQEGRNLIRLSYSEKTDRHGLTRLGGRTVPSALRQEFSPSVRLHHFMPRVAPAAATRRRQSEKGRHAPVALGPDIRGQLSDPEWLDDQFRAAYQASMNLAQTIEDLDYISAMRSPPQRTYHHTGETHSRIGADGQNWANALAMDLSRRSSAPHRLKEGLKSWLLAAGLASDVRIQWTSDRYYEVQVQHPLTLEYENIADVGQGNSQVLPVLIGGLRLQSGATYVVEEPEIHLHPKAQAELGTFFLRLYNARVQSLIETHSEYLILRLQQHVAAGEIPPEHVAVYYVDAGEDGKRVTRVPLDGEARFGDALPGGFFPEKLDEAKALARARAKNNARAAEQ